MNDGTLPLPAREVIVRFSHVDGAGIVFYPRYIEMLAQAFPELSPGKPPFVLELSFIKPTPLGTRLTLRVEARDPARAWRLSGAADGDEQFTASWASRPEPALAPLAHDPAAAAFRSEAVTVRDWTAGPDGRLHLSRYYEHINAAVEQWFDGGLGLPFARLHRLDRAGIPTVSLSTRCRRLPRLGETFETWIRPSRLGSSAIHFDSWLVHAGECLVTTAQVVVYTTSEDAKLRSAPLPDSLRTALRRQLAGRTGE